MTVIYIFMAIIIYNDNKNYLLINLILKIFVLLLMKLLAIHYIFNLE